MALDQLTEEEILEFFDSIVDWKIADYATPEYAVYTGKSGEALVFVSIDKEDRSLPNYSMSIFYETTKIVDYNGASLVDRCETLERDYRDLLLELHDRKVNDGVAYIRDILQKNQQSK
jgi:hypothetical protein